MNVLCQVLTSFLDKWELGVNMHKEYRTGQTAESRKIQLICHPSGSGCWYHQGILHYSPNVMRKMLQSSCLCTFFFCCNSNPAQKKKNLISNRKVGLRTVFGDKNLKFYQAVINLLEGEADADKQLASRMKTQKQHLPKKIK